MKIGDVIVIFCTGLGELDNPVPAGLPAPPAQLSQTVNIVTATVGGLPAPVAFSRSVAGIGGSVSGKCDNPNRGCAGRAGSDDDQRSRTNQRDRDDRSEVDRTTLKMVVALHGQVVASQTIPGRPPAQIIAVTKFTAEVHRGARFCKLTIMLPVATFTSTRRTPGSGEFKALE